MTLPVVWDMETGDPDDFLCLLWLAGNPGVDLRGVTITPGTPHQVGMVRWALEQLELDIPVGAHNLDHGKECVSSWHYRAYEKVPPSRDAEQGWKVLSELLDEETTLITGAPLKNIGTAVENDPDLVLGRWVAQGGFAGDGVVPPALQMDKFRGHHVFPTYNLGGAWQHAMKAIHHPGIQRKLFVSKNVCHRVYYDQALHDRVLEKIPDLRGRPRLAMELIAQGMSVYLEKRSEGKKFHDPLAATCALDESICTFREIELFREKGKWGSYPRPGSNTWISIDYDEKRFHEVLLYNR